MALVEWRNTPSVGMQSSPARRLMSRRTKSTLPVRTSLVEPKVVTGVKEQIKHKRREAKYYFDRRAKELPDLKIGEPVLIQTTDQRKTWEKGMCVKKLPNRSHVVESQGVSYRRNQKHVRPDKEIPAKEKQLDSERTQSPDQQETRGLEREENQLDAEIGRGKATTGASDSADTERDTCDSNNEEETLIQEEQSVEHGKGHNREHWTTTRTRKIHKPERYQT